MLDWMSSSPEVVMISTIGDDFGSRRSTSSSRSSSRPSRSIRRNFSRVALSFGTVPAPTGSSGFIRVNELSPVGPVVDSDEGPGGSSRSRIRSSALASASPSIRFFSSSFTMLIASSTRSRTIDSTSRPT